MLFLAGLGGLGRQLTPFPKPNRGATLVQSGAYGIARHPIYGGAILAVLGWSLLNGRWAGLVASALLAAFFDRKASREEQWLVGQFAEYPAYRKRVRKLIPWFY
jgi:protein-S-isoprenylcysteine O-methyltransferase Ste14